MRRVRVGVRVAPGPVLAGDRQLELDPLEGRLQVGVGDRPVDGDAVARAHLEVGRDAGAARSRRNASSSRRRRRRSCSCPSRSGRSRRSRASRSSRSGRRPSRRRPSRGPGSQNGPFSSTTIRQPRRASRCASVTPPAPAPTITRSTGVAGRVARHPVEVLQAALVRIEQERRVVVARHAHRALDPVEAAHGRSRRSRRGPGRGRSSRSPPTSRSRRRAGAGCRSASSRADRRGRRKADLVPGPGVRVERLADVADDDRRTRALTLSSPQASPWSSPCEKRPHSSRWRSTPRSAKARSPSAWRLAVEPARDRAPGLVVVGQVGVAVAVDDARGELRVDEREHGDPRLARPAPSGGRRAARGSPPARAGRRSGSGTRSTRSRTTFRVDVVPVAGSSSTSKSG